MKERPRLGVGALVFYDSKIVLLKSPKWRGRYIVPSGHVRFGEKLEDAVIREVREETGLEVYDLEFLTYVELINSPQYFRRDLHFVGLQYACKSKTDKVRLNVEATDYVWIDPKKALDVNLEQVTRKTIMYWLSKYGPSEGSRQRS